MIGFEFETSWMVQAPANTIGMDIAIVQGTNWHAEPDMRPPTPELITAKVGGYGNLEFITDAFPETAGGLFDLKFTMNELVNFVKTIEDSWRGLGGWGLVPLHEMLTPRIAWGPTTAGLGGRNEIMVDRGKRKAFATPQMTAGIRRVKVSRVLDLLSSPEQVGVPHLFDRLGNVNAMKTTLAGVEARARTQAALPRNNGMTPTLRQRYEGTISHLGGIVALGANFNGSQMKYIHPLLSRTNFGSMSATVRGVAHLIEDVVISSGRAGAAAWGTILGHQLTPHSTACNMTIGAWLTAIVNGNDPLNWGQKIPATWAPAVMGPAGHQSKGHVYEFRGLNGNLPSDRWYDFAVTLFTHIRDAVNT